MFSDQTDLGLNFGLLVINSAFLPLGEILSFSKENKCGGENLTWIGKRIRNDERAHSVCSITGHQWRVYMGTTSGDAASLRSSLFPPCTCSFGGGGGERRGVCSSIQTLPLASGISSLLILDRRDHVLRRKLRWWVENMLWLELLHFYPNKTLSTVWLLLSWHIFKTFSPIAMTFLLYPTRFFVHLKRNILMKVSCLPWSQLSQFPFQPTIYTNFF